jgi:hypothetical protein
MAVFRAWFDDDIAGVAGGSLWFNGMEMSVGDNEIVTPDCRFVVGSNGPFSAEPVSCMDQFIVSAVLEVR